MSTCALVKFIDTSDHEFVTVYHHYNGWIKGGIGESLARFLNRTKIINGICGQKLSDRVANGYGCLIAQYIAINKKDVGNVYIRQIEIDEDNDYIDYIYYVIYNDKDSTMKIRVVSSKEQIFEGSPEELLEFISEN